MRARFKATMAQALSGGLGALRWAVMQRSGCARANHLLIMMATRGNNSFECYMSVGSIADAMECHPRTVRRCFKTLLVQGYILDITDQRPHRRTNTYLLCPSAREAEL